jgi:hypothetical protein
VLWRGDSHYGRVEAMEWAENDGAEYTAYDTAVSLWPKALIELRQGARVVLKTGE